MTRRMLIDASAPGEIRVAVVDNNQLVDYDFEAVAHKQWKSSIFLAQVTRVEPSLQAAFLEYGALRQGFLALPEIHPDYYRIPIADREQLNAALKQSAAEARAEAEAEDGIEAGPAAMTDINISDDGDAALLAGFTKVDILDALLEMKGLAAPRDEVEPVLNNCKWLNDALDDLAAGDDEPTDETTGDGDNQRRGRNFRGRSNFRHRRREMDPEQAEAQRRRNLLRSYKIQEVIKRRQVMLVQVNKEERGTKGAALTTYISLPGRYCVLMPNSPNAGGVSRKITNPAERKRMKEILSQLTLPEGMGVILRTAGLERPMEDIARDLDYLVRLWGNIRELTLKSTAPALVYEEGDLITRAIRDLYSDDIAEILVSGDDVFEKARDFMGMLLPDHVGNIKKYDGKVPLFTRYGVDDQIDAVHTPSVQLPSGGYIVINQTEALVAIDVNSGRATRERNIEETAYRTNLEAATEIARQVRLRDLAGLVVVDFIDMEDARHRIGIERRMRDAMKADRARVQIGRISSFGLLEMSRQRLRPSVVEAHFTRCEACGGSGWARSVASSARHLLRAIEGEALKNRGEQVIIHVHSKVALYALNQLRAQVTDIETRYGISVLIEADDSITPPDFKLERPQRTQQSSAPRYIEQAEAADVIRPEDVISGDEPIVAMRAPRPHNQEQVQDGEPRSGRDGRGGRRFRGRGRDRQSNEFDTPAEEQPPMASGFTEKAQAAEPAGDGGGEGPSGPRRTRGRRGGRGRNNRGYNETAGGAFDPTADQPSVDIGAFAPKDGYINPETGLTEMPAVPIARAPGERRPRPPRPAYQETHAHPADMPVMQDAQVAANGNGAPAPLPVSQQMPPAMTPVVTRVSSSGETAETNSDGSPRKGWWKKLMES